MQSKVAMSLTSLWKYSLLSLTPVSKTLCLNRHCRLTSKRTIVSQLKLQHVQIAMQVKDCATSNRGPGNP
eukprot:6323976-Amphidinium_carterae.1